MFKTILFGVIFSFSSLAKEAKGEAPGDSTRQVAFNSDRPGISDNPSLISKRGFQIQSGFNYEFNTEENSNEKVITYNSSTFRYGISRSFELRLNLEYLRKTSQSGDNKSMTEGFNAVELGSKIFISEGEGLEPTMCLVTSFTLPYLGHKEFRSSYISPTIKFCASHSLTSAFCLTYNLGAEWSEANEGATGLYTCSAGYKVLPQVEIFLEGYGYLPEKSVPGHGLDAGLSILATPYFQLDFSAGTRVAGNLPDGFLNFGFSWKL